MDSYLREEINNFADAVREEFNIPIPIKDMEEVVRRIGGRLEKDIFLPRFADGKIQRQGDSFLIVVSELQSEKRKRFSIAHELGHLFLHMGYMVDEEIWENNKDNEYFRKEDGELEFQAHEFAAALLMPKEKFINVMSEYFLGNGKYDMEKVAKFFDVSLEAAVNRGKWLGLLAWG